MEITIRAARPSDAPALLAIEEACFGDPWGKRDLTQYDCLVAAHGVELAGFLIWREIFPGDRNSPAEVEILNMAVNQQFRRRGIASALLARLLARPGLYFLEVRKSNVAGLALYQHLGFVEVGRRAAYYRNPTETAIVMRMKRC